MQRYTAWDITVARDLIGGLKHLEGAMLPILHALQDEFGYIDPLAEPLIADALNLSLAEVHGVISFYHDFRRAPPGRRVVKLCRAEACQAVGCEAMVNHMASAHSIAVDTTSADGALTFETVYCLGNCALGPAALVDGALVGRLTEASLSALCRGART
jgi:formate dehydrogenase subunit gamma